MCYLIGHGLFNTVFHQPPLEGVFKLHPFVEIESQHANFTVPASTAANANSTDGSSILLVPVVDVLVLPTSVPGFRASASPWGL